MGLDTRIGPTINCHELDIVQKAFNLANNE